MSKSELLRLAIQRGEVRPDMNQREIDELSESLRSQGLTWNQTNFAVSLVRNCAEQKNKEIAELKGRLTKALDERDHFYKELRKQLGEID